MSFPTRLAPLIITALLINCVPQETSSFPQFDYPLDDKLRLHHIQVKGTHNSYHLEPELPIHPGHRYSHLPLDQQLATQGVRAFELDLHFDNTEQRLAVLHLGVFDEETTCPTFETCLQTIKGWSDQKRDHLPILVWLEIKTGADGEESAALTLVEETIAGILPDSQLLTPSLVQGNYPSMREALREEGWPLLGDLRGRVCFIFLNGGALTEAYLIRHPNAQGGIVFPSAGSGEFEEPWAAFAKINDPSSSKIAHALTNRILVASNICMADNSDEECYQKRDAGLSNGVTMLKDDFPGPVETRDYWLQFPDNDSPRCNPLTAPPECFADALEQL